MKRDDERLPIWCDRCERATHVLVAELARGVCDDALSFAEFAQWERVTRAETEAAIATFEAAGDVANAERGP